VIGGTKVAEGSRFSSQRLDAIICRLEQDVASSTIPGATIMLGSRDQVLFERSVGFRDVTTHDPLQLDAIWRIYSMTKPLVTAAAMTLVEQGLLRLDQPVARGIG
jgi:CubicO group peptidase (beta-lactamase class C family)